MFAQIAYAQSNESTITTSFYDEAFDYRKTTLFSNGNYTDAGLADIERQRAAEAKRAVRYSGKKCYIKPGVLVPIEWSCVCWARHLSGINVGSIGSAKFHPTNSSTPAIGAIVVFNSYPDGHLAVVTSFTDTTLTIAESNYVPKTPGVRTISRSHPNILGFYIKP